MEIKVKVKQFLIENSFGENVSINDDTMLFQEGLFDSMGFISLLSFIEEQFRITPQDNDLIEENFESLNAITKFISDRAN